MKFIVCLGASLFVGCATNYRTAQDSEIDAQERRSHREVFYSNWLRPSVSEEDKDFFYRSFWKRN